MIVPQLHWLVLVLVCNTLAAQRVSKSDTKDTVSERPAKLAP